MAPKFPSLGRRDPSVDGLTGAETCRVSDSSSRDFEFGVIAGKLGIATAMFNVVFVDSRVPRLGGIC